MGVRTRLGVRGRERSAGETTGEPVTLNLLAVDALLPTVFTPLLLRLMVLLHRCGARTGLPPG